MFNFINLDDKTRSYMLAAIEDADRIGNIYYSARFNDAGRREWVWLLKHAAAEHNAEWLAEQLASNRLMRDVEGSKTPGGGYSVRQVPSGAPGTFAEGQFNRFYMLGLSRRAREEGVPELEVYRARQSPAPRAESEAMIGQRIPVSDVETQLRDAKSSLQSSLLQPNSGLSLKIPSREE